MLNQAPCDWSIDGLIDHLRSGPQERLPDGKLRPARPYGFFGLRSRLRLAWLVFTGRADALSWPGDGPKAY